MEMVTPRSLSFFTGTMVMTSLPGSGPGAGDAAAGGKAWTGGGPDRA
jgi:hypothetical protein